MKSTVREGEKNPEQGSEIEFETVCLQTVGALYVWLRGFWLIILRVMISGKVNKAEPKGNRVLIGR